MKKEYVFSIPADWKHGTVERHTKHNARCATCGGKIWFGFVQFAHQRHPAKIKYSFTGTIINESMRMEVHNCQNPAHTGFHLDND